MRRFRPSSMALLSLLLSLLIVACGAPATTAGTRMVAGNRLYEEGRYAEAAAHYQTLVDQGIADGRLYYNLGNAYFKAGDLGRAILNYRRARRLLPRDEDVATNLKLARAQTLDRIEIEDRGIVDWMRRLIGWTTLDEAAIAALALWICLCGLGVAIILQRQRRRILLFPTAVVAILLLVALLSLGARILDERGQPPAVVLAEEVPVRSGPGQAYLTEFTLHAGAEVRVVERRADWTRIALPGDLQGWVPDEAAEELY